ncbi:MAG: RsmB/NOP family class I SAM-dependent RNA methyltransferase [Ignisphaera sp.]|uniref:RsmB/NOP family class I SAM-dependent RNA methyltransferase n=1 Tax=Ignisphaera aggregans TaxID=334771 RepID=A0A7J3MWS8_9CREN
MGINVDNIVAVISNTIYLVEKQNLNIDRAFTYTCRKYSCHSPQFTREDLFNIVHDFVSRYIFLRSVAEKSGRRNVSYRALAKLYLYIKLKELGLTIPSKLSKVMARDFGELEDNITSLEPWQRLSYPKWIYYRLLEIMDKNDVEEMLEHMNRRIIWLRINTLKINIDKALHLIDSDGIEFNVDKSIPFIVRVLRSPIPVRSLKIVKEGAAIIQDKASVLTVIAMDPKPDDLIYDFAAAPGIKTSLIMQLTENKARVVALDRSPRRLMSMKVLLKKYGVNVDRVDLALTDSRIVTLSRRADLALVDAPCSSSGAIPKDPSIKIMLMNQDIPKKMQYIQFAILKNAIKHSERIVYATCSILPEEGEEIIQKILHLHDIELENITIPASRGYKVYNIWNKVYRTYPHIDECEGFFISRIKSIE